MNKNKVEEIVLHIIWCNELDKEKQSSVDDFFKVWSPWWYPPVLEDTLAETNLNFLKIVDEALWEVLDWYLYQWPWVKYADWTIDWKQYPVKTVDNLVDIYFAIKENETH